MHKPYQEQSIAVHVSSARICKMDQLFFHCPVTNQDVPIDIRIDVQSLSRLRDTSVGVHCRCGQSHELKVAQLFRCAPELPPLPTRQGGISG